MEIKPETKKAVKEIVQAWNKFKIDFEHVGVNIAGKLVNHPEKFVEELSNLSNTMYELALKADALKEDADDSLD